MNLAQKRKRDDSCEKSDGNSDDSLKAFLSIYLNMQEYSDVILRCGERRFDLHRFIVAPQSTWFAEKCAGRSRGWDFRPEIVMDETPLVVALVITYFYTHDYSDGGKKHVHEGNKCAPLMINALVYNVAAKYNIAKLKELATLKTKARLLVGDKRDISEAIKLVLSSHFVQDRKFQDLFIEEFQAVRQKIAKEDQQVLGDEASVTRIVMVTWCQKCKLEEEVSCYCCKSKKVELKYQLQGR